MSEGQLSDVQAQKRQRRRAELEARQRKADIVELMESPAGRRFLWRLIGEDCLVFCDTFNVDSRVDARLSGRRSVGVSLMAEAQRASPEKYLEMLAEASVAQKQREGDAEDNGSPREDD